MILSHSGESRPRGDHIHTPAAHRQHVTSIRRKLKTDYAQYNIILLLKHRRTTILQATRS